MDLKTASDSELLKAFAALLRKPAREKGDTTSGAKLLANKVSQLLPLQDEILRRMQQPSVRCACCRRAMPTPTVYCHMCRHNSP